MSENNQPTKEQMEKLARDLALVNEQRGGAIKSLRERLSDVLSNENVSVANMSQHTVKALRDLAYSLNSACQALDAHDKLMDMVIHDVTEVIQIHDKMAGVVVQTSAYTQTLLALLKKKGFTTDEELQQTWNELSKAPPVSPE